MAEQMFFVEDTVCLRSSHQQIGVVDRTFSNVETHSPNPEQDTLHGTIQRGHGVNEADFEDFLLSGVPPKGTALISWILDGLEDKSYEDPILLTESDLCLVDRALIFGDIVKRDTQNAMSGTITQTKTIASILQFWTTGNSSTFDDSVVQNVPVDELKWVNEYEREDLIIYKGWVGVIQEIDEDIYLRLSNNTVVIPEDCEELRVSEELACQVNQVVSTRKANLRRGRWIYGAYDANVEPSGTIVEIRPRSIAVQWLCSKYPKGGGTLPQEPPPELESPEIESGEIHIYDRRRCLEPSSNSKESSVLSDRRANLDVALGDRVRFRDLNDAKLKYGERSIGGESRTGGVLRPVSRTEVLGYDVNVYMIVSLRTYVDVSWQDGTITAGSAATDLIPYLDLDNEEEVWPGELVMTKEELDASGDYFVPARAGIVQTVNAPERMAQVTWFASSSFRFTRDRPSLMMPDSYSSKVGNQTDEVSLYDIFTTADFARRLGDLVVITPSPAMERSDEEIMGLTDLRNVLDDEERASSTSLLDSRSWIGEVIELGRDGLLTIRLSASYQPRDVKIPWECTYVAHSSDQDSSMDGLNFSDESEGYESDDYSVESADDSDGVFGVWRDEYGNEVEVGENLVIRTSRNDPEQEVWRDENGNEIHPDESSQWSTDDEASSERQDGDDNDIVMTDAPSSDIDDSKEADDSKAADKLDEHLATLHDDGFPPIPQPESDFSYASMFTRTATGSVVHQPERFAILEESVADDHHFVNRADASGSKLMRQIRKEHKILQDSLPDGAYVRTWESNMQLMRLLLLGPLDTPYEYAPFVFDIYVDSSFPRTAPEVFFHSWTDGRGPCNPNLYEDGKVCLSLLGTWPGDKKHEGWNPGKSSILQIIVSLLGLVLVKEPYYNEAGFEVRIGTVESRIPSAQYSERTFFKTRAFIAHAIENSIQGFEQDIAALYTVKDPGHPHLLRRAIESGIDIIQISRKPSSNSPPGLSQRRVTAGALAPLTRHIEMLLRILAKHDREGSIALRERF